MKSSKSVANVVRKNTSDQEMRSIRDQFFRIACQVQDPKPDTPPIPLHVFRLLNPVETLRFYQEMIRGLSFDLKGKQIAVDGKTSRGRYNEKGKSLLHLVPIYETETGISLMKLPTKNEEGKDVGEFNTIPKVLEKSDIKGVVVIIDAGCGYAEITETVTQGGADYIVVLKENQPTVYAKVESQFNEPAKQNNEGVPCYRETNKGHGREEGRTYYAISVQKGQLPEKGLMLRRLAFAILKPVKAKKQFQR